MANRARNEITVSESNGRLHQVSETWSPYNLLSPDARNSLRRAWRDAGFSRQAATLFRYELDMLLLRGFCAISPVHRRHLATLQARTGLKVHLGCGNSLRQSWINVDCYPPTPVDGCETLVTDMRVGLPLADNSVDAIFSEHFLEHVPMDVVCERLLPECRRILAPGGAIRFGVPDAELWIEAYVAYRATGQRSKFIDEQSTAMSSLDSVARGSSHCALWDYETLSARFAEAGFVNLRKARAEDTLYDSFREMDQKDPWRVEQTVYIEGIKPAS
jgi:predicted SAM-dependent methyltransferase